MEKIISWYLHARLSDCPGVTVDPRSETMKLIDVQGYRFLLTHGTQSKTLDALAKQTLL